MRGAAVTRVARWVALLALVIVYVPTFRWMVHVWWWDSYAAHGVFVPLFSAHFLWIDRAGLPPSC